MRSPRAASLNRGSAVERRNWRLVLAIRSNILAQLVFLHGSGNARQGLGNSA